jgi:hypothetical protein
MNDIKTINYQDKVYRVEDMSSDCLEYLSHMQDLDRKLKEAEFNVKQLRTALAAFTSMFNNTLPDPAEITPQEENNADQEVQNNNG